MVVLGSMVKLVRPCVSSSVLSVRYCGSITSQYVRVEDKKIHVVRKGSGPQALLLLPGALGSALTDFKPQLEGLDGDKVGMLTVDGDGERAHVVVDRGRLGPPRLWQVPATCAELGEFLPRGRPAGRGHNEGPGLH